MAWGFLIAAIVAEVIGTTALAKSNGFTRLIPSIITVVGYGTTFALFAQALKTIPVGVAYAIWAGAGTALVAVIGILFLGEPVSWIKVTGLAFVIVGVVALNLSGAQ